MKKIMFFVAAAFVLVAVGCSKDEVAVNDEVQYITEFKADFAGADTRIAVTHNPASGLKFSWENGDKLYIYAYEDNKVYATYEYESTGNFKHISGTAMAAGKKYFATNQLPIDYPLYFTKDSEGKIKYKMTLGTEGVKNLPLISDIFLADTNGTIAKMHHTVGVVEIPVMLSSSSTKDQLQLKKFAFNGGIVAGQFFATSESPYFMDDTNNNVFSDAWVEEAVTLSKENVTSCFIPVFPGNYASVYFKYKEDIEDSQVITYAAGTNVTVACGKITKLEQINLVLE